MRTVIGGATIGAAGRFRDSLFPISCVPRSPVNHYLQMEWLITNAVAALLIPPGILLVLLLIAVYLTWRRPPLARGLVLFSVVALYALSTHFVAGYLVQLLEPEPRDPLADKTGQAIVVLGAGIYSTPEYGGIPATRSARAARYTALPTARSETILAYGGA